ncbi:MAG: ABC transporter permease [Polyangiaceae bacterium]|nr:ABC transporter permease [Polyangiaceae bacterium]
MNPFQRAWRGSKSDWRLYLLSVFSVAVAFVCLAAALLVVVNAHELYQRWGTLGRASVYLVPSASREAAAELAHALEQTPGVTRVRYVPSIEARKQLQGRSSDPVLDQLPDRAFPSSLEIDLARDLPLERIEAIQSQLETLPAVENVETYGSWTERLGKLLAGGVTAALLLAIVVLAAVASVVSSTIRLALQRRRVEVEVLKLVGATDSYVRQPFLVEGAAQGAAGALLAVIVVGVLYGIVLGHFDAQLGAMLGMSPTFLPFWMSLILVVIGGGLGAVAAFGSLRKLLVV